MSPRRNNKRFFDYEGFSNIVPENVVITTLIVPTVQLTSSSTSTTTTTTTSTVHSTSTTVSIIYSYILQNMDYLIYGDSGQGFY